MILLKNSQHTDGERERKLSEITPILLLFMENLASEDDVEILCKFYV